jgi:hypothetical protein
VLAKCPNGWVVDGGFTSKIGTIVEDASTDVICTHFPFMRWQRR